LKEKEESHKKIIIEKEAALASLEKKNKSLKDTLAKLSASTGGAGG